MVSAGTGMVSVGVGTRGSGAGWRWALAAVDSEAFGAALYGPRLRGGRAVVCFIMAVRMEERRERENIFDATNNCLVAVWKIKSDYTHYQGTFSGRH